jgi:hypothetical protein
MFWFWVALALAIVLGLAVWSDRRGRRVRGSAGVTSDGAYHRRRDGVSAVDTVEAQAEISSRVTDQYPGGVF